MAESSLSGAAASRALFGDRILLVAVGLSALTSIVLGMQFVDTGLAFGLTAVLLLLAAGGYGTCQGVGCQPLCVDVCAGGLCGAAYPAGARHDRISLRRICRACFFAGVP